MYEIGTMPVRLMSPVEGLSPTIPHAEAGPRTETVVSVPSATCPKVAAIDRGHLRAGRAGNRHHRFGARTCLRVWDCRAQAFDGTHEPHRHCPDFIHDGYSRADGAKRL